MPAGAGEGRDAGPRRWSRDAGSKRIDDARNLHAERQRRFGPFLIPALDHQEIREVESAGRDPHPDFAWPRLWPRQHAKCRCLSESVDAECSHAALLLLPQASGANVGVPAEEATRLLRNANYFREKLSHYAMQYAT